MNKKIKTLLRSGGCLLLALLMLLSCVACNNGKQNGGETETTTEMGTDPDTTPSGPSTEKSESLKYLDLQDKPLLRAAFVGRKETEPLYTNLTGKKSAPVATVGATWTETQMTVYVNFDSATSVKITLNGVEKEATLGTGTASAVFTHAETELHLADLGQYVPLKVVVGNGTADATFDGFAELREYTTVFYNDGTNYTSAFRSAKLAASTVIGKDAKAGAKSEDGKIVIFDHYDTEKGGYASLRNWVEMKPIEKVDLGGTPLLIDFDMNIKYMPVTNWTWTDSFKSYGFSMLISEKNADGDSVMFTFVNTPTGIAVYNNGTTEATSGTVFFTGKKVGEDMRVGFLWENGNVSLYIDGYLIGTFEDVAEKRKGYGDNTISWVWQRTDAKPTSIADDFEVTIDNLGVATVNNYSAIATLTPESVLGEDRRLEGEEVYLATGNLTLVPSLTSSKYGINTHLYWESSDPSVISLDGTVNQPTSGGGILVTLTARVASNDFVVAEREFQIYVKSTNPSTNVLWKKTDTNPYTGSATAADNVYIVDGAQNSIVYDMGSKTKINRVSLHSVNEKNRVTGNFVALYVSDDNENYNMIPGFCMLHSGTDLHFFNFEVEARYIKVHFSYTTNPDFDIAIYNSLQRAMSAYYTESALLDGGASFAGSTTMTVKNDTDKTVYDKIVIYTLDQLGIATTALKADLSDIRFRVAGKECPHYYANGRFYVRVPEIAANSSATVTVYYGNTAAEDISNGVTTLEIEYGTKMVTTRLKGNATNPMPAWRNTVGVMPNGDLLRIGPGGGNRNSGIIYERSTDGGHTWQPGVQIGIKSTDAQIYMKQGGGFIVDYDTGTVFFLCYGADADNIYRKTWIMKSTDSGVTWTWTEAIDRTVGGMTYSDGIKVTATYDGEGPGIDYLFTVMVDFEDGDGDPSTWGTTDWENGIWKHGVGSLYSTDNGATWQASENHINFGKPYPEEYWGTHESGISEETVWEKEDGTLILYARHQSVILNEDGSIKERDIPHFVVAYSFDHGVTWDEETIRTSNVYTTETQPIIEDFDGTPILLWGGNNSHGFRSYDRFPLNVAISADDAESFLGILDISAQTYLANRIKYRPAMETWIVTNPDIAIYEQGGVKNAYIVITNQFILIENFENYLYKTKGAYDSFEIGSTEAEGWVTVSGTEDDPGGVYVPGDIPTITTKGATHGDYAMALGSQTLVSRSIPYVEKGEIFFDLHYSSFGSDGTEINFQSAYNVRDPRVSSPIRLLINDGGEVCYYDGLTVKKTGLTAKEGDNSFTVSFDLPADIATLTVNGQTVDIAVDVDEDYICFVNIKNSIRTANFLDNFGVVDLD